MVLRCLRLRLLLMYTSFSDSVDRRSVRILKFGGTSVGTPDVLRRGIQIIRESTDRCQPVVVVSAAGSVTDQLVEAADAAPHARSVSERWANRVGACYRRLATAVIPDEALRREYASLLRDRLSALAEVLTAPVPKRSAARDAVLAAGERLMSPLLAAALSSGAGCHAESVDASELVRTDASHGEATVHWERTREQVREWYVQRSTVAIPVVTGFIGGTEGGRTTTLGRGGSDYSAALLARALNAKCVERWSDVEALYTSDPANNGDAKPLSRIPAETARRWTKEGRLGLHPRTIDPLDRAGIPLHVRCTHRPEASGTRIVPASSEASP